jgi:hypothetical protein
MYLFKSSVACLLSVILTGSFAVLDNLAPAYGQSAQSPSSPPKVKARLQYQDNKYVIGPGDVLALKVMHEPEYTQENILVRPDGYATFPGAGDIYVADQSVDAVTVKIVEGLSETIVSPQVSLSVSSTRPSVVYLSGEVVHPGMFQLANNSGNATNIQVQGRETLARTDMRLHREIGRKFKDLIFEKVSRSARRGWRFRSRNGSPRCVRQERANAIAEQSKLTFRNASRKPSGGMIVVAAERRSSNRATGEKRRATRRQTKTGCFGVTSS